jgi:hypothetical protein
LVPNGVVFLGKEKKLVKSVLTGGFFNDSKDPGGH